MPTVNDRRVAALAFLDAFVASAAMSQPFERIPASKPAVPQALEAFAASRSFPAQPNSGPATWNSGTYQYDGAGNIIAIGEQVFTYDLDSVGCRR